MVEINNLLNEAFQKVERMHSGEKFYILNLFDDESWTKISKGNRIKLGKLFLNRAKSMKM